MIVLENKFQLNLPIIKEAAILLSLLFPWK